MSLLSVAMEIEKSHACDTIEEDQGLWYAKCMCGKSHGQAREIDIAVDMHTAHILIMLMERFEP